MQTKARWSRLRPWPQTIPGLIAATAVLMLFWSWAFGRSSSTGFLALMVTAGLLALVRWFWMRGAANRA